MYPRRPYRESNAGGVLFGVLLSTMTLLKEHPPTPEHQVATHPSEISMRDEVLRKGIHLTSILIPLIYLGVEKLTAIQILVPLTILAVVIELMRTRSAAVENFIQSMFGSLLRRHERLESRGGPWRLSGATWVMLSATICVAAFPKVVAITAFSVLIVSDTVAALIGRRYGRRRFLAKSVEGSSAFFLSAVLIVLGVAGIYSESLADSVWTFVGLGIVASFVATVAEAMSYGINIDDNLTIPLSFGLVLWPLLLLLSTPAIEQTLRIGAVFP